MFTESDFVKQNNIPEQAGEKASVYLASYALEPDLVRSFKPESATCSAMLIKDGTLPNCQIVSELETEHMRLGERQRERDMRLPNFGNERIELPQRDDLLHRPVPELEGIFRKNQEALLHVVESSWKQIPFIGFHGTSREGYEGICREGASGQDFNVWTIGEKSSKPAQLLIDLLRAAEAAVRYADRSWHGAEGTPGPILVIGDTRMHLPGLPPKPQDVETRGPDLLPGCGYFGDSEHFGRGFVKFSPENFKEMVPGTIGRDVFDRFTLPQSDRSEIAAALQRQAILFEAFKILGIVKGGNATVGHRGGEGLSEGEDGWSYAGGNPKFQEGGGFGSQSARPERQGEERQPRLSPVLGRDSPEPRLEPEIEQPPRTGLLTPETGDGSPRRAVIFGRPNIIPPLLHEVFNPAQPPGVEAEKGFGEQGRDRPHHIDDRATTVEKLVDGSSLYHYRGQLTDRGDHSADKVSFTSTVNLAADGKTILGSTTEYQPPVTQEYAGEGLKANSHIILKGENSIQIEGVTRVTTTLNERTGITSSIVETRNGDQYIFEIDKNNRVKNVFTPQDDRAL